MTPEVQQYLLAGFLLLAAVFAVPLLKRGLTPVKKRISDRIPTLVGHLLRCFLRPAAWLVRVTLAGWALLTIPWSAEIRALLSRAIPYYQCVCAGDGGVGRMGSNPGYLANAASPSAPGSAG